jgi:hypothetical protein
MLSAAKHLAFEGLLDSSLRCASFRPVLEQSEGMTLEHFDF